MGMNFFNIFSVSYLKSKGIRRICFVLGLLLSSFMVFNFVNQYDNIRLKDEYDNLYLLKKWYNNYYDFEPMKAVNLAKCANEYFINIGFPAYIINFDKDQPICYYGEDCEKLKVIADFKIKLDCGKETVFLIWPIILLFVFYFPFLICALTKFICDIIKWIYMGFQEEK